MGRAPVERMPRSRLGSILLVEQKRLWDSLASLGSIVLLKMGAHRV
jgi:hypothetical protein